MASRKVERWSRKWTATGAGTEALFTIPRGWAVIRAYANVLTARVGGTSVTLGDGTDVDGYFTETALVSTSTGVKAGDGALLATGSGKVYSAADTVDVVLTGSPSTMPVIRFMLDVVRVVPS